MDYSAFGKSAALDKRRNGIRFLANSVLATALMPYVAPIPWHKMNVQWFGTAVAIFAVTALVLCAPRYISWRRSDTIIILLGVVELVYLRFSYFPVSAEQWLRACGTIILGFPVYYAVRNLYQYMSPRVFLFVVAIYLSVLVFELISFSAYESIFSHFLSEIRRDALVNRGPNGLCNEASMMGDISVLLALSIYFFHPEHWRQDKRQKWCVLIACGLMLAISQSGTGFALAFGLLCLAILTSRKSWWKGIIGLGVLSMALLFLGRVVFANSESRGARLVSAVAEDPRVALEDPSVAERLFGIYVAGYSLPRVPLGTGRILLDTHLASEAWYAPSMAALWPEDELREFVWYVRMSQDTGASVANMIQRMGLVGLMVIVILLSFVRGIRGTIVVQVFLLALMLNASLFISTFWYVIGSCIALQDQVQSDCDESNRAAAKFRGASWSARLRDILVRPIHGE